MLIKEASLYATAPTRDVCLFRVVSSVYVKTIQSLGGNWQVTWGLVFVHLPASRAEAYEFSRRRPYLHENFVGKHNLLYFSCIKMLAVGVWTGANCCKML